MKTNKKISVSLILGFILSLIPFGVFADEIVVQGSRLDKVKYVLSALIKPADEFFIYLGIFGILCTSCAIFLMTNKKALKVDEEPNTDGAFLPALEGIRAFLIAIIFIFHDYLQTWIRFDFKLFGKAVSLEPLQRYGYLAVEAFFVLSGFCLFYSVSRYVLGETKKDFNTKEFYIKRARRILPAYLTVIVLVMIFPILAGGAYPRPTGAHYFKNLLSSLTFTQNMYIPAEGAFSSTAWTLCIEVQFYLLMPLVVKGFKKNKWLTFLGICLISLASKFYMTSGPVFGREQKYFALNFFDEFAIGMIASYALVYIRNTYNKKYYVPFMSAISLFSIPMLWQFIINWIATKPHSIPGFSWDYGGYWQTWFRGPLALVFAIFLVATCLSAKPISKWFYGNCVMRFLSSISYAFFLCHQNVHILLARTNIPPQPVPGKLPITDPKYIFCTLAVAIALSIVITYLIEKPIVKYGVVAPCKKLLGIKEKEVKKTSKKKSR